MEMHMVKIPKIGPEMERGWAEEDSFPMVLWEMPEIVNVARRVRTLSLFAEN